MESNSMTALVSAFARSYHAERVAGEKVFDDRIATLLLRPEEREGIARNMTGGISFFNPGFSGDAEEALAWVVNHQLAPSPLGRAAFAEGALKEAVAHGARQYLILGAGLDSFALRQPTWAAKLEIFEIDLPASSRDKAARIAGAGLPMPENLRLLSADLSMPGALNALRNHPRFRAEAPAFVSLLGFSYYLCREDFAALIAQLRSLLPAGSRVAMDYPTVGDSGQMDRQRQLAAGAGEGMRAAYAPDEMREMLSACGLKTLRDLAPEEITQAYFSAHNRAHPDRPIFAAEQVHYLLAEMA